MNLRLYTGYGKSGTLVPTPYSIVLYANHNNGRASRANVLSNNNLTQSEYNEYKICPIAIVMISWIIHSFWLVLTMSYWKTDVSPLTTFLLNKTKIFHLTVNLSNETSQRTVIREAPIFSFKPHFDIILDPLLNRRTTTYNIFFNPLTPMI